MLRRTSLAVLILASLAGCNTVAQPSVTMVASTATHAPPLDTESLTGKPCGEPILSFRKLVDSDVDTGYLDPKVYERLTPEVARAAKTCAAGETRPALAALSATKQRYGYR